ATSSPPRPRWACPGRCARGRPGPAAAGLPGSARRFAGPPPRPCRWRSRTEMAAARRPRILVVDDDPAIATTFETILSGEGYDVVTALEGARAVELASREPWDVALLDLVMPGLDGLEVLRRF